MDRKGFTLIEMMSVTAILLIFALIPRIGFITVMPNYSEGERTGVVVKLSHKGMIWKTWEGEMNIGSMSSDGNGMAVPTVFDFSVKDEKVVDILKNSASSAKRVTIVYRQALIRSLRDGETQYLAEQVR